MRFPLIHAMIAFFCAVFLCAAPALASTDRMSGTLPKSDIAQGMSAPGSASATESGSGEDSAVEKTEPASGPAIAEVVDIARDVRRIESLGTLATFREGSLGSDIWTGTHRSSILALLPQIPAATGSSVVTDLLRRAMLTEASASGINNDVGVRPGQDFITLKLEYLLAQGAYQDALDLYSLIRDKPYDARLGKAGIIAMLYTGNIALACLESRSVDTKPADDPFWGQLDAWCSHIAARDAPESTTPPDLSFSKILKGVATDKGYRFPLRDLKDIAKLSPLERAALLSEGRFDYSGLKNFTNAAIAPDCLTLPLYDAGLPLPIKLQLASESVRRGFKPVQYLVKLYRDIAPPNEKTPDVDLKNAASATLLVPFLFRTADRNPKDDERWAAIQQALDLRPIVGWAPLLPFAEVVREINPGPVSPETAGRVAEIVMRAGYTLPGFWLARLEKKKGESDASDTGKAEKLTSSSVSSNVRLAHFAAAIAAEDDSALEMARDLAPTLDSRAAQAISAISEGLGLQKSANSANKSPYVNIYPLTQEEDYVMPSFEVLDDIERATDSKTPGDVILLSALAMNETEPEKAYPGTVRRILAGYEAVGLHHEARKLAVEAILGLVN